jgi:hypothetical protein
MNENDIVLNLLRFYKSEGIDLHQILDDPIFIKLSLQTKIQMIKSHAEQIKEGTTEGISKADLKHAGTSALFHGILGAMSGAAASAAAAKLFAGGRISPAAIVLGSAPGFGFGLAMSALQNAGKYQNRNKIRHYLGDVARDQDDYSAIRVLAKSNLNRASGLSHPAFNKFLERIENNTDERSKEVALKQTVEDNVAAGRVITQS